MDKEVKTMARMPRDIHEWFRHYAKMNNRSMNRQLITILQDVMAAQQPCSQAARVFGDRQAQR
ncbi:Arc family DNA-binding protein [Paralcaligenes ureilyticus]|uniref:Arc family DNA-binding protein n=1 Tax=Paralcaligenes ureilyticus TaxID=627131 RepID=UPI00104C362D|nr:Arc family DNA-binding protein [Paralcaligenes ureilyticus]